jgi:hypothetical protein
MKKSIISILISSIFLVQCYAQYQYLPNEYKYNEYDRLVSITLSDSSEQIYKENNYQFLIESDSLLIIYKVSPLNKYNIVYSKPDTLSLNNITSLNILEYEAGQTTFLIIAGFVTFLFGIGLLYVIINGIGPVLGKSS